MLKSIVFVVIVFFFNGCEKSYPELPTVKQVDIQKYLGTWYEIARFEHFFEKGCKNVTATYQFNEDGTIRVLNRCTLIKDNKLKEAQGIAYAVDSTNSKLKVSFFRPFYGDYYIIDLAEDYSYAVVGSPNRELLWILSRTKNIQENTKEDILKMLPSLGFNPDRFIWTIQE